MAFRNPYILSALPMAPVIVERLVQRLSEEAIDARPDAERFTVREIVCHLADWDEIFLTRLRDAVTTDDYRVTPYDEGEMAVANHYASQSVAGALKRFSEGRAEYVAYVGGLSSENLDRQAIHPDRGLMTAADLIDFVVGHDVYHIEQLSALLE